MLAPANRIKEVERIAREACETVIVGDPMNERATMGPIANERQYRKVLSMIEQGIADGAKLLIGGTDRPGHCPLGFFVSPTIFSRVSNRMAIAREEIFGPVWVNIPYEDVDEAVAIANESHFDR